MPATVLVDGYEVTIGENGTVTVAGDGNTTGGDSTGDVNPTFTKVCNEPYITGFNKEKAFYVAWDLNEKGTEYEPNEVNMKEVENKAKTIPSNWYDYTEGKSKWANVKTTGGGNDCYWVWIPRYAYKVPTKPTEDSLTGETIEIAFLKDTGSTIDDVIDETKKQTIKEEGGFKTTPTPGTWVIHPAFTAKGNGGFGELKGIWVAKFEASSNSSEVVENPTEEELETDGGGDVTNLQVRVKPNVTNWRNITLGKIFTVCKNLTSTGNSLEGTIGIDSHMMKNTEWGAVAYLSRSVYGKNGEVWNNPYYNNETNCSSITGLAGDWEDANQNDLTNTYKYNETGGGNASTTGNVYGVYDMAGGAWEQVAGILSRYKYGDGYNFSNSVKYPNKYFDWYAGNSSDKDTNYYANSGKYGDAVYETSCSGSSISCSWEYNYAGFPWTECPVFARGGATGHGCHAGVFAFDFWTGDADIGGSFRPVVLSSQS